MRDAVMEMQAARRLQVCVWCECALLILMVAPIVLFWMIVECLAQIFEHFLKI